MNSSINVNWVPGITLDEMEKACILAAFRFYRGNKSQTAYSLKISVRTLEHKLEKYEADKLREDQQLELERAKHKEQLARMRGPELTRRFCVGASGGIDREGNAEDSEKSSQGIAEKGNGSSAGVHVEPTDEVEPQSAMPLPEPKKVQAVLSRQASSSSQRGRR